MRFCTLASTKAGGCLQSHDEHPADAASGTVDPPGACQYDEVYFAPRVPMDSSLSSPCLGRVLIIGAGPAGLTCAYELQRAGVRSVVLERDEMVGGLSRTDRHRGYLFDIGGHRFYTKLPVVEKIWREVLGEDLLIRPRLSRIYYKSRFFRYPIELWDVVAKLGPAETVRCGLSFLHGRLSPIKPEETLEAWVSNRFGKRLFRTFFQTYTEKVWGISCKELRADWAAQRIRDLSLSGVIGHAIRSLFARGRLDSRHKTLISQFYYPRLGPGMMWQKTAAILESSGSEVHLQSDVEKIFWEAGRIAGIQAGGRIFAADHYVSSMAIRDFLERMDPPPGEELRDALRKFNYRDFITVLLIVRGTDVFPDNWIYIHDPEFKVGRIQNFRQWSAAMVPDLQTTSLGLEYFCHQGDDLWEQPDAELLELARAEVTGLGLVKPDDILDGAVRRVPKAYPVYDTQYKDGLAAVQKFLGTVSNLQFIGRNGMHHYNNQDHSMLTGILAARNILGAKFDLWKVNLAPEYLEAAGDPDLEMLTELAKTQPLVPRPAMNR